MHMRRRAGEGLNGAHLAKGGAESMTFDPKPGDWREVQNRAILAVKILGGCSAAKVESCECFFGVIC